MRTRTQVTPSVSYRLSPRTTVTAQYDLTTESLAGAPGQSVHAARVGVDYGWSGRTQWGGRYLARSFVGSPFETQYSHALLMAWTRQVAPNTNLFIQGGPRVRSYDGVTTEFLASFFRRKPRQRFLLDYWHGETIVLGVPGPVDVHSGSNRTSWLVRSNLEAMIVVGVFRSASLTDERALVYYGGVGGSWTLREFYTLTAIYSANYQRGESAATVAARRASSPRRRGGRRDDRPPTDTNLQTTRPLSGSTDDGSAAAMTRTLTVAAVCLFVASSGSGAGGVSKRGAPNS